MESVQTETAPSPAAEEKENFILAILAGLAAAILSGGLWAAVTVVSEMKLGIMAIAVGFIVGYAIKHVGNGEDEKFRILGALCGLIGCVLGNTLSILIFVAQTESLDVMQLLSSMTPDLLVNLNVAAFQWMDLVFYAIAIYEGYKFSVRD